jgi:hypothetical protein
VLTHAVPDGRSALPRTRPEDTAVGLDATWRRRVARGQCTWGVVDGFVDLAAGFSIGRLPVNPLVLLGQMTTAGPRLGPLM